MKISEIETSWVKNDTESLQRLIMLTVIRINQLIREHNEREDLEDTLI